MVLNKFICFTILKCLLSLTKAEPVWTDVVTVLINLEDTLNTTETYMFDENATVLLIQCETKYPVYEMKLSYTNSTSHTPQYLNGFKHTDHISYATPLNSSLDGGNIACVAEKYGYSFISHHLTLLQSHKNDSNDTHPVETTTIPDTSSEGQEVMPTHAASILEPIPTHAASVTEPASTHVTSTTSTLKPLPTLLASVLEPIPTDVAPVLEPTPPPVASVLINLDSTTSKKDETYNYNENATVLQIECETKTTVYKMELTYANSTSRTAQYLNGGNHISRISYNMSLNSSLDGGKLTCTVEKYNQKFKTRQVTLLSSHKNVSNVVHAETTTKTPDTSNKEPTPVASVLINLDSDSASTTNETYIFYDSSKFLEIECEIKNPAYKMKLLYTNSTSNTPLYLNGGKNIASVSYNMSLNSNSDGGMIICAAEKYSYSFRVHQHTLLLSPKND